MKKKQKLYFILDLCAFIAYNISDKINNNPWGSSLSVARVEGQHAGFVAWPSFDNKTHVWFAPYLRLFLWLAANLQR